MTGGVSQIMGLFWTLICNEIRMAFNGLIRTLRMPTMLFSYAFVTGAVLFVTQTLSTVHIEYIFSTVQRTLAEDLSLELLYTGLGIMTAASVLTGYFGKGAAGLSYEADEHILMPSPIRPYQLFLSCYIRRLIRRVTIMSFFLILLTPLIYSASVSYWILFIFSCSVILYLEFNYMISGLASMIRARLSEWSVKTWRHVAIAMSFALFFVLNSILPTLQWHAASLITVGNLIVTMWSSHMGLGPYTGEDATEYFFFLIIEQSLIAVLITAYSCDVRYYETLSARNNTDNTTGLSTMPIKRELDFTLSRFRDPMMWVFLKDMWIRWRTPLQPWKYIYFVVGVAIVIWLYVFSAPSTSTLLPSGPYTLPVFSLIFVLLTQIGSMSSLLSFSDEQENVYILKSCPIREADIILGKYLESLIESGVVIAPLYGTLILIFRSEGLEVLVTLGIPLLMVFCAIGVLLGAYVPVISSSPRSTPLIIALSFPVINIVLGLSIMYITLTLVDSPLLIVVLPLLTLLFVGGALKAAVRGLNSYK